MREKSDKHCPKVEWPFLPSKALSVFSGYCWVTTGYPFALLHSTFQGQVCLLLQVFLDFPGGSDSKASAYNVGDLGSIPGLGGSPGEGNGNSLQYSCLENPMDRGSWQAPVRGVVKSWTRLSDFTSLSSLALTNSFSKANFKIILSDCKRKHFLGRN